MKTIITVQHPQSVHHTNGMVGSWTDWELTDLGKEQARNIARRLRTELTGRPVVLYSSDLKRAAQTAEIIASALGVVPVLRPELRERNLGRCCGRSVQWLKDNRTADERTVDDRLFPDAESRRDEWERLRPFFDEIVASQDETVLLVSHGDLLSVFNAMFAGLDVEHLNVFEAFGLSGGVSQMEIRGDGRRFVRRMSDMSYVQTPEK